MKQAFDILFLGMESSPALADAARQRAAKLEQVCNELISCRVTVELAHKHKRHGRTCCVRIDVSLPGHELTVAHEHTEDAYAALGDAFDSMKRRLEAVVQRERGRHRGGVPPAALAGQDDPVQEPSAL